ncbi:MAG: hypothetical protein HOV94_00460 [Saccharothrix sp.]|nr:hypothetical protein [Saccharothrix sp.]
MRRASPWLSGTAYLLTGDAARAEALLRTALARSWRVWWRVRRAPEAYAHRVLVRTYAASWGSGPEPGRSPEASEDVHVARMSAVAEEVRSGRRRRTLIVLFGVLLCVLLAGAAVITVPSRRGSDVVAATTSPSVPHRDGEYRAGVRIVAEGAAVTPDPVTVRYKPRFGRPGVFTECVIDGDVVPGYQTAVALNGVPAFAMPCGGLVPETADWRGLVVGKEAVVTVTAFPAPQVAGVESPPVGVEVRVSLGEPVPVDEYPLPPRPSRIASVEKQAALEDGEILLRSDWADPDRVQQVTVMLPEEGTYRYITNAPGRVLVDFGGVTRTLGSWDYSNYVSAHDLPVTGGEVTITVRPEDHRGDWVLLLVH